MNALPKAFACSVLVALCSAAPLASAKTDVLGWVEKVQLKPANITVKAKLDTGALTSSLHAEGLEKYEQDGDEWVRFRVQLEDADTEETSTLEFEREIERYIRVRGAGGSERRPVVKMKICVGNTVYNEQFSLNDRDKMIYPILLGRRTLEELGAVDSSRTFVTEPDCSD